MKRFFVLLCTCLLCLSTACAESLPSITATPKPTSTPLPVLSSGELDVDFSMLQVDQPNATPVAVDPIDKPTPTPMPTPAFTYEKYTSEALGISFYVPYTWLINPNTNQQTMLQFVEPVSEMMDVDGYQTRMTIEKIETGLKQTSADARERLQTVLEDLKGTFTSFVPGSLDAVSVGKANGFYCYYKAEYTNNGKTYLMNGRIMMLAYDRALYMVRITTPRAWYSYYEYAFRKLRSTLTFL